MSEALTAELNSRSEDLGVAAASRCGSSRSGLGKLARAFSKFDVHPPIPGVRHHFGPDRVGGHGRSFHEATVKDGFSASEYFARSGLSSFAEAHGGLCSFRLEDKVALLQVENRPLVEDEVLAPSIDLNRHLFGAFMGALENDNPARATKRAVVERLLGSARVYEGLEPSVRQLTRQFLSEAAGRSWSLDDFALLLVAHIDSYVPGVLDLRDRPLTSYLRSAEWGRVARDFFGVASDVISTLDSGAAASDDLIVAFTRQVLRDNADSLALAPTSNLIRGQFDLWQRPLEVDEIERLSADELKELGTLIVATYDTTALSLLWAIAHIESSPAAKAEVVTAAEQLPSRSGISALDLAVLEAVRLGGSNPTALWRRTVRPVTLTHAGRQVHVPPGCMLWLDRWRANRDQALFPRALQFDLENIRSLIRTQRESLGSTVSRNRYEINSFSMVNVARNPRKCPARYFAMALQATVLAELYAGYDVSLANADLVLKRHSSMPRPASAGVLQISPRRGGGGGGGRNMQPQTPDEDLR